MPVKNKPKTGKGSKPKRKRKDPNDAFSVAALLLTNPKERKKFQGNAHDYLEKKNLSVLDVMEASKAIKKLVSSKGVSKHWW